VKKSETVKKGLFEPFLSIFNYQWPFILFKNLINHSNNGPKNKLRVESIRKYQLKKGLLRTFNAYFYFQLPLKKYLDTIGHNTTLGCFYEQITP
jgi:hypothetical protein